MDPCKRNCFAEIWVDSSLNLNITLWDLRYNAYQHPCDLMATKRATKNAALRKVYTNNLNVPQCFSNEPSICRQHIVSQFLFSNTLGFGQILIKMQQFWLKKMHLKRLSAKWRPFCHGHISVIMFCTSSEIILNAIRYPKWKLKSTLQRCTDGSVYSCPRQQAITWIKFCQIHQVIYRYLWSNWDLLPNSKRIGDTVIFRLAIFQIQKIWHDFCFRLFIRQPGFDTIVTFAS